MTSISITRYITTVISDIVGVSMMYNMMNTMMYNVTDVQCIMMYDV